MKRLTSVILIFILVCGCIATSTAAGEDTSARAYVLYCVNSGEVLLCKNPDERLPMASTTKIMTTLLTLEEAQKNNRVVTFTEEMTAEGSSMYLEVGEKVTLDDLAVGMMMQSGNDAANAAAIAIAGSFEAFAERMNTRADEIGMHNTHFVTPSGLDDKDHRSTARDMALLMAEAMKNERFREITGSTSMTVTFTEPSDKRVTYANHNRLLSMYNGCIGGKTGYTDAAGRCLVTAAERDGLTLIAVTLDDGDDWNDHIALYDKGFERYALYTPELPELSVSVVGGVSDRVAVVPESTDGIVTARDKSDEIQCEIYLPPFVYAPVRRGEAVGRIVCTSGGKVIGESRLLSADHAGYNSRRRGFFEYFSDILRL